MKLSVHPKWLNVIANLFKAAAMDNVDEDGEPIKEYIALVKRMARSGGGSGRRRRRSEKGRRPR